MRAARSCFLALACVVLGARARACSSARSSGSRRGPRDRADTRRAPPARNRFAADGRDRARARRRSRPRSSLLRGSGAPRPRRPGPAASSSSRRCAGRAPGSPSRCGSCSRSSCAREREITVRTEGGVVQEVSYSGRVPHLIDERLYRPAERLALAAAAARAPAAERQPRHLRRLPGRARARPARRRAARGDRMSAATAAAGCGAARRRDRCSRRCCRARPALEGSAAGPPRPDAAPAVPRAAAAVGQEHGRRRGDERRLPARAGGRRGEPRSLPCCSSRPPASRRTGASATTRSRSPACSRSRGSRSPPRRGTSRTASR